MSNLSKVAWEPMDEKVARQLANQAFQLWPFLQHESDLQQKAAFYKALGDETRLKIIGMLNLHDLCMCEIVAGLEAAPSTLSHHLKLLERGGVITSRREGKFTIYKLEKERICFLQSQDDERRE